jgi:hypothetical protein
LEREFWCKRLRRGVFAAKFLPVTYGFGDVLVKEFVDQVANFWCAVEIARHARSFDRGEFVFEPRRNCSGL